MRTQATDQHDRGDALRLAAASLRGYTRLLRRSQLRLQQTGLGLRYRLFDGRCYQVFRDTIAPSDDQPPTVIEVTFELKLIGSARAPHWLFQRLCILTTPFWSGFDGFAVKLWMVHPETCRYAGIYQWGGAAAAQRYLDFLLPVLRVVSVPGSVSYRLHPHTALADFLRERAWPVRGASEAARDERRDMILL